MDDPALDAAPYTEVLHDLAQVNTVTLARRPTLDFLRRAVGGRKSFRCLDVGFGDIQGHPPVPVIGAVRGIRVGLNGQTADVAAHVIYLATPLRSTDELRALLPGSVVVKLHQHRVPDHPCAVTQVR